MTGFLPASNNAAYHGSRYAAWFLIFLGISWIGPGLIHSFLPDGGAGVIAGIDLSTNGRTIIAAFAWAGATQLAHGLVMLLIGLRYRPLVPALLAVSLMERSLLAYSGWIRNAPPVGGHHPPEHYASLIAVPLLIAFLWLSRPPAGEAQPRRSPQTSR